MEFDIERVKQCLGYLQAVGIILKDEEGAYSVKDARYADYMSRGVPPVHTKILSSILDDPSLYPKDTQKYLNLASMALAILR